ncbi:MAG: hypothetical protein K2J97_00770 [Muribaculaceae bacterium]|nr:hypothetical protein [Muribaculaceae bacterium]
MSKEILLDKIKGGWAGQTIECTYGGPTEFNFRGALFTPTPLQNTTTNNTIIN